MKRVNRFVRFDLVIISVILINGFPIFSEAGHRYDATGKRTWSGFFRGASKDERRDPKRIADHKRAAEKHTRWEGDMRTKGTEDPKRAAPVSEKEAGIIKRFSKDRPSAETRAIDASLRIAKKDRERIEAGEARGAAHEARTAARDRTDRAHEGADRAMERGAGRGRELNPGGLVGAADAMTGAARAERSAERAEARAMGRDNRAKERFESESRRYKETYPDAPVLITPETPAGGARR